MKTHGIKPLTLSLVCVLSAACQTMSGPESAATAEAAAQEPEPQSAEVQVTVGEPMESAQAAIQADLSDAVRSPLVPSPPDLWRDMRASMHLDLHLHQKRVQQEISWLQRHPQYLPRLAQRMQTYLPYLYEQVRLRDLPTELALLPIVESALDTYAFSHGGASGPWQFIRGTARQYGLDINDWYDGRRDVVASTGAALDFLEDLHARFDDWYLALAGYNAGQGNVNRALRRNPGASFFDLRLPRETQYYVPRLLALVSVIKNPEQYQIKLPPLLPQQGFALLNTHSQFQLSKLSQIAELSMDDLYRWNPALNQWATPPHGPHRIIVPISLDLKKAQAAIDAVPARQRVDWQQITVKPGDTLSHIAHRHGTDVASLRMANNLKGSSIRAGTVMLIPTHAQALRSSPRRADGELNYVVMPGDSLWSIARAHKVSLTRLMRNNHLGPKDPLPVGRELKIPGVDVAQRKVTRTVRYKVRKGDSLARIAQKFNVSVKQIASWNKLDARRYLQPGQGLTLYINVLAGR